MRRPAAGVTVLVGLLLLVTAAGMVAAFAPVLRCPDCAGLKLLQTTDDPVIFFEDADGRRVRSTDVAKVRCLRCADTRRITLLSRWRRSAAWEGRIVAARAARGFKRTGSTAMLDRTGIRLGQPVSQRIVDDAREILLLCDEYSDVRVEVTEHLETPGKVKVLVVVTEVPK